MFIYRVKDFIKRKRLNNYRAKGAIIGDGCDFAKDISLGSEPYLVKIGNHVRLTSGVKITTHDGGMWVIRKKKGYSNADIFGKVEIGNNVHIGFNSIIMPGVKIGDNVIVGCGAIVTKNIPKNSVAVGTPARVIESIDEYLLKHNEEIVMTKSMTGEKKRKFIEEKYI